MKILFEIRHPAHFHHFIFTINELKRRNHEVKVIVSYKDVLSDLLYKAQVDYQVIGRNVAGIRNKIIELMKQNVRVFKVCQKFRPDLFIGRPSQTVTLNSKILSIPSIVFAEDDFNAVFFNAMAAYPFANIILTPYVTKLGPFEYKKIGYSGYQKLAYLHPNKFTPDVKFIKKYIDVSVPYFILRFSKLSAIHDINASGFTKELAYQIIEMLKPHGNIYISSEKYIEEEFKKYKIKVPPDRIHHALHFSDIFISDSQTMTMEAALLGTPSLRYSSFVGKLSYLEELEWKYQLSFGFKINEKDKLVKKISDILNLSDAKALWNNRVNNMLKEKIDVTDFMIWFIENYPKSVQTMKVNPDYQYKFR